MLFGRLRLAARQHHGAAARLRRELPRFYPRVPRDLVQIGDTAVRETIDEDYEELLVVGHSLGGVVVRRAVCDVAQGWLDRLEDDPRDPRPALLNARLRLFSPASAGFRPGGWLALVRGTSMWGPLEMFLRRSSAYSDLQPESPLLADTRRRTEALVAARRAELRRCGHRLFGRTPTTSCWRNATTAIGLTTASTAPLMEGCASPA